MRSPCDRHDFTVVETIDFFDDEDDDLPAPMTQKDVVLLNRANAFRDEGGEEEPAAAQADGPEDVQVGICSSSLHVVTFSLHWLCSQFQFGEWRSKALSVNVANQANHVQRLHDSLGSRRFLIRYAALNV